MDQRQPENLPAIAKDHRPIQHELDRTAGKAGQHLLHHRSVERPHINVPIRQPAMQPHDPRFGFGLTGQKQGDLTQGQRLGLADRHSDPGPVYQRFAIRYWHDRLQSGYQSVIDLVAAAHELCSFDLSSVIREH